jgi:hypothetical protein
MRNHRTPRRIALSALAALASAGLAACGNSNSDTAWSNVTRVTIGAVQPSVYTPPGTKPHPVVFSTPQQLKTVTRALNANHIHKLSHAASNNGCAGGVQITIVIAQQGKQTTKLGAYRCGTSTTGDIAGNLTGFLTRTGVSVP